jgi:hypothetical protein
MKVWVQKNGRAVGGLFGIAAALAFCFDLKTIGAVLAGCAIVSVVTAERTKKASLRNQTIAGSPMTEKHIARLGFLLRCGVDVRYKDAHGDVHVIKALLPNYDLNDGSPPGPAIHLQNFSTIVFIEDVHPESFVQLVPASSGKDVSLVPALWD